MSNSYNCAVIGCNTSLRSRLSGFMLHSWPKSIGLRQRWFNALKNKCRPDNMETGKICSKHFESKYITPTGKLRDLAVPSLFNYDGIRNQNGNAQKVNSKLDKHLNDMPKTNLEEEVLSLKCKLKEPLNLLEFLDDKFQPKQGAPLEAKLWLLIKRQSALIEKLTDEVKDVDNQKKEIAADKSIQTHKFIIKSLQERQATLEEQVEILTAIESK